MIFVNKELQLFIGHRKGHYIGNVTALEIIVMGLYNIHEGDSISFTLKDIYNVTDKLKGRTTIHEHTISSEILSSLSVGDYEIIATLNDGQQAGALQYKVVQIPEIIFASLTPNELQIPIREPVSIIGKWTIQGEEMNAVCGLSELIGMTVGINQLN